MQIAENVYAVLDMFHPMGVNAGFIVTKKHIVYIDAGMTIPCAKTILGYSMAVAAKNKPKYLIFTDHHSDHIFGMKVLKDVGAKTLGHVKLNTWLKDYMIKNYRDVIKTFGLSEHERELIYGDVELYPLDETISEDTAIRVDDEEINILTTPGHWEACLSVYVPSSKVLFAGDTIYSGFTPTTRFGNKKLWRKWVDSLEKLRKLDISCIVPGHGRLCDTEEISRHITYLKGLIAKS